VGAFKHQPSAARQYASELAQGGEILRLGAIAERGAEVRVPRGTVYGGYDCQRRSAGGPCPARAYINAAPFEAYVVDAAFEVLTRRRSSRPAAVAAAAAKLEHAERALRRYRTTIG
jgi:hypothetical protein